MENDRILTLLTRKLSGEASNTELQELEMLLQLFPTEKRTEDNLNKAWAMKECADPEFLEATYLLHIERMHQQGIYFDAQASDGAPKQVSASPNNFTQHLLKKTLAPAILIAVIGCVWAILPLFKSSGTAKKKVGLHEISIPNGERSKIFLPDGTSVWLNAGSKLKYKDVFDENTRVVELSGEAFFDVVSDTAHPFVINTTGIAVKVTGTRFNIKAYPNDPTIETSLIKGQVEVTINNNPRKKYQLQANQQLVLTTKCFDKLPVTRVNPGEDTETAMPVQIKKLSYLKGTDTDIASSWTKNIISFEDEVLPEVANKMERWYDVDFTFKNKKWERIHVNGTFEKENLEQAMIALQYLTGFNYKINNRTVTIY